MPDSERHVKLWLTRDLTDDRAPILWRHRPRFCVANNLYFNGGECMRLADTAFPGLPAGACKQVEVIFPE